MPRAERRAQLLDAAVDVFCRRGYHGTSMDDIAAITGVTKPVLYQHFTSKSHLYSTIVRGVGHEIGGTVRDAHDDPAFGECPVERASTALVTTVLRDDRARMLTPTADVAEDVDEIVTEQRRYVVDGLAEALTQTRDISREEAAAISLSVFVFVIAVAAAAEPEWRTRPEQQAIDLNERKASLLSPLRRALLTAFADH